MLLFTARTRCCPKGMCECHGRMHVCEVQSSDVQSLCLAIPPRRMLLSSSGHVGALVEGSRSVWSCSCLRQMAAAGMWARGLLTGDIGQVPSGH